MTAAPTFSGTPSTTTANAPAATRASGPLDQQLRGLVVPGLDPEAAEGVDRLGGQADVAHHRDLGVDQCPHHGRPDGATLELDAPGAGPDQGGGVADGVGHVDVVAEPRQVADDQRPRLGTGHGGHVVGHVGDGHLQGVLVAEDDIGHRVAHEDHVDAGGIDDAGAGGVVGGDHHQGLVAVADLAGAHLRHGHGRGPGIGHGLPPLLPSSARRLPAASAGGPAEYV